MIKVKGFNINFYKLTVLNGIDIVVERGQVLAIIGPSGSGRSTFLRCLYFLEQPDKVVLKERACSIIRSKPEPNNS